MSARPLLALAGGLAFGCLSGNDVTGRAAGTVLALAGCLLLLALRSRAEAWGAAAVVAAAVALGAVGAGIERAAYDAEPLPRWLGLEGAREAPVLLRGVAAGDARDMEDRFVVVLDLQGLEAEGRWHGLRGLVKVEVGGHAPRPEILDGDRVSLWAHPRAPRGFATPGAYDALEQARHEGIVALAYCKSQHLLRVEGQGDVGFVRAGTARARRWARVTFRRWVLPGPEEALVRAMVLGDRSGLDARTSEALRVAGTYHVLAISGAQVVLVAALLLAVLRRLVLPPLPLALLVSAALVLYAALVGGDVPVVRAAIMAIVVLGGRALDLDSDPANLLGLAAAVLLLHRPSNIGDVGFQLSFGATLAIVLLTPTLLAGVPPLPLRAEVGLASSLAAQAALAPLLAAHFHRLSPVALVLNLAAVPLSGAVLLAGLGVLLAAAILPAVAAAAGDLAWMAGHALLRTSDLAVALPGLDRRLSGPPVLVVALHVAGLVLLGRGQRRRGLAVLGLGLAGIAAGPPPRGADGRLHLTVLDVGQGDCLLIQSPGGKFWLIDAGGAPDGHFDLGEAVVGPYLWSERVRQIEALVISHAHPDHVGGVPVLLRAFAVGEVWEGPAPRQDGVYRALDQALRSSEVARRAVVRGVASDWDGVAVEVLAPRSPPRPPWKTRNDDSVVLALRLDEVRFLLAGDIEQTGEAALAPPPSSVLKVPHHGSRTSSTPAFLAAASPRVAVVSVGLRNRFGHPHPEVLERYAARGVRLLRTDQDGAVTVSTDGKRLWIRTARAGQEARLR